MGNKRESNFEPLTKSQSVNDKDDLKLHKGDFVFEHRKTKF